MAACLPCGYGPRPRKAAVLNEGVQGFKGGRNVFRSLRLDAKFGFYAVCLFLDNLQPCPCGLPAFVGIIAGTDPQLVQDAAP
jgi:hypothetical protein